MEEHKGNYTNQCHVFTYSKRVDILLLLAVFVWRIPTDVDDLVVLVGVVDRHGHIVVRRNNLRVDVSLRNTNRANGKPLPTLTSWKSSLNLCLSS
jgi:hypothetical protein